jgi:hypothetical protein
MGAMDDDRPHPRERSASVHAPDPASALARGHMTIDGAEARRAIAVGSIPLRRPGTAHGGHPCMLGHSIGVRLTEEPAAMRDTFRTLPPTKAAREIDAVASPDRFKRIPIGGTNRVPSSGAPIS